MSDNNEKKALKEKPQYYYFYGSTEDATSDTKQRPSAGPASPTNDQDSLVGEALVPTDNELEDESAPASSAGDLPHVLLTKGTEVQPLIGRTANGEHSRPSSDWSRFWTSCRERHPIVHISLLGGALAIFLFVLSIFLFPNGRVVRSISIRPKPTTIFRMPFQKVNRAHINDPESGIVRKDLFAPELLYKGKDQSRDFTFPFPTGAFWTNLVLKPTADRGLSYPIAVYPYAYKWSDQLMQVSYPAKHRKEEPKAIHDYFIPDLTFSATQEATKRHVRLFDALSVTLRFLQNSDGYWETYLVQGSPYVTIKYHNASPVIHAMSTFKDAFCPRGEDGLIKFDGQRRRRLDFGVCSTDSSDDGTRTLLRGVQFIVQTAEDMYWLVFASEPITLVLDRLTRTTISAQSKFNGVLRFAFIPPFSPEDVTTTETTQSDLSPSGTESKSSPAKVGEGVANLKVSSSKGLQRLIYHAGVYPVAGSVRWTFRPAATSDTMVLNTVASLKSLGSSASSSSSSSPTTGSSTSKAKATRIGTMHFDYVTKTFAPTSSATPSKALLMLALPHHAQSLPLTSQLTDGKFDLVYKCIKGPMTPVLGASWAYDEVLPTLGFDGDSGSNSMRPLRNLDVRRILIESIKEDIKLALPSLNENVYGFGKQSARLAQLAHIAKSLLLVNSTTTTIKNNSAERSGDDHKVVADLLAQAQDTLYFSLERFLASNVSDALVFDGTFGGLVSTDGVLDSEADFGNGLYNDHHFHYGYMLYACAVMGNLNSTFVEKFGDQVDAIYLDVAYDSNMDSQGSNNILFPAARHKMWFDGHSFASGLFPFGNGKSQESSSEAVNCYYGAYLWSLVRHGAGSDPQSDLSEQTDFARFLLATEIRGARSYWHMSPPSNVTSNQTVSSPVTYGAEFSKNYMVGNLGMLDAVCSTWFGTENLYVHMINFIPVTSVTGELFSPSYVSKELAHVFPEPDAVEMAWRGYLVSDLAIVHPNKAWQHAQELFSPELDSGLSKTQVLYWIATRHGFNPANVTHQDRESESDAWETSESSTCEAKKACVEAGLTGDCCPTSDGVFLGCCGV